MHGFDSEKHILDFPPAMTPALCEEAIDILTQRYPDLACKRIGESILSHTIPCLSFGRGRPSVVWIGAQSGGDAIISAILLRFLNEYHERMMGRGQIYGCNLRYLHELRRQYIIPMLNPDGVICAQGGIREDHFLYSRIRTVNGSDDFSSWQANARGVDLRQNYAADGNTFMQRKQTALSAPYHDTGASGWCGEAPESEPESAALCRMLRSTPELGLIFDVRTGKAHVEMPQHADRKTASIARQLCRLAEIPLTSSSGENFCDWAADTLKIPAFTLFCGEESEVFALYAGIRELLFVAPTLIGK